MESTIPFTQIVCLMSGGLDSSIAAWCLGARKARTLWPLYVRRGAAAERHELKALKRILPWLRQNSRGRIERLKTVPLAYPPNELKAGYPATLRDSHGYVGRETVFVHTAAFYALTLGVPRHELAVATGSLAHDLFAHNSPRFWKQIDKLLQLELGDDAIATVHPLQAGSTLSPATKADVVRCARAIGFPLGWARSCVAATARPCGVCIECRQRTNAEREEAS